MVETDAESSGAKPTSQSSVLFTFALSTFRVLTWSILNAHSSGMPPKKQRDPWLTRRTLVLDNGGHSMKAGFATAEPDAANDCHVIPNCIARSNEGPRGDGKIYVADQLEQCKDTAEMVFRRPIEKGFLVNWDGELDIWKQAFFDNGAKLHCDPHETNLILTESPNCPQALQSATDQMIFEEFEFASAYRCIGS